MNQIITGQVGLANEGAMAMDLFARRFQARQATMLIMPPLPLQQNFEFPRNSIYHFVSFDPLVKGPSENDPRLVKVTRKMSVEHIRLYAHDTVGKPQRTSIDAQNMIDHWHRTQKRFRKSRDTIAETPGEDVPAIFNYGLLPHLYRYVTSTQMQYYRWENMYRTVISTILRVEDSPRTNFIFLNLPTRLPAISRLTQAIDLPLAGLVRQMDDPDQWMILELFKWFDRDLRPQTIFAPLKSQHLHKIDLIIEDSGRFLCLNMGKLDDWLADKNAEPIKGLQRLPMQNMRRNFMGALIALANTRGGEELTLDDKGEMVVTPQKPAEEQVADYVTQAQQLDEASSNLDKDLMFLEKLDAQPESSDVSTGETGVKIIEGVGAIDIFDEKVSDQDVLVAELDNMASQGQLTYAEHRRMMTAVGKSMNLKSPYTEELATDYAKVPLEMTEIKDVPLLRDDNIIVDKSLLKNSLKRVDADYIKHVLPRDKVACVLAIQRAGYIVTGFETEQMQDILGSFESTRINIQPINGKASPIILKQAVMGEDGRIRTGNSTYRLRAQAVDNPIRKVNAHTVALASYYGKNFVQRSDKTVNDYGKYLCRVVSAASVTTPPTVTAAYTEDVFRQEANVPRSYSALASQWRTFQCQGVTFYFDWRKRYENFDEARAKILESMDLVPVGTKPDGTYYALDKNNTLYECKGKDATPLQPIEEFLGGDPEKAPEEFAECVILGKAIPAGLVLGSYFGLTALLRDLKVTPRQVVTGQRLNLQPGEWPLAFDDVTYIFSRSDQLATMVLAGLTKHQATIKRFPVKHFDSPQVYAAVMESMGLGVRHVVEVELLAKGFVDPITMRKLQRMGEPTRYPGLVKRACEMLITDKHARPKDQREMRYRRAERLAGNLYTALYDAIRTHKTQAARGNVKLDISPYEVWHRTMKDRAMVQVKDINPIHALKEVAAITVTGNGGRTSRSFNRANRAMDHTEVGISSEHSVDSRDVGVNTFHSASPRLADLEGSPKETLGAETPLGEKLSIAALVSPFVTNDDTKRANFVSIQHSHGVPCDDYYPSLVMTGAEATIAERVDDSFAAQAHSKGVVKSVNPHGLIVQYNDGSIQGFELGRRQGKAAGQIIPHDIVTDLKVGDIVEAGDTVTYHKGWFRQDRLNKKRYYWMNGLTCRVAFLESRKTHEDACSISEALSQKLTTTFTTEKHISVRFDQNVHEMVKVGQAVQHGETLCVLSDDIVTKTNVYSDDSLNTLKALSGQAPVVKVTGMIDDIIVYYNGEIQDMSPTLQDITTQSDKRLRNKCRDANKPVFTGAAPEGYRHEGEPLLPDTVDIVICISHRVGAGVADKAVVALQLKTEISEVYSYPVTTQSGLPIDLIFGGQSVFNRIVLSPPKIGTTTTLLKLLSKKAGQLFQGTFQ